MKLDEIFTFENLYSAYKNCRMSKQHKGEVIRFESNLAVNLNIVNKAGAWFSYNGDNIGQGREAAKTYLKNNPEVMAEIEKKVRDNFNLAFEKSLGEIEEQDDDTLEDEE